MNVKFNRKEKKMTAVFLMILHQNNLVLLYDIGVFSGKD